MFLHSVKEGPTSQSYGLQVAALAGIPGSVIADARRYLSELERKRDALHASISSHSQLPLFSAPVTDASVEMLQAETRSEASAANAALEALRAIDPNDLSPRQALELVFRLRELDRPE